MISIVMAYFNRKVLLDRTIETIKLSKFEDYEIVVVDDASDIPYQNDFDKVRVIRIEKEDKWWVNCCVPFNIGFRAAKGDVIIIQNPECRHEGDVLTYVNDSIHKGAYISVSAFNADQVDSEAIENGTFTIKDIMKAAPDKWYNHPYHRPINFHFCCAILKEDLNNLGGFDERYALGIAYDDTEFIRRIYRNKLNIIAFEYPLVIHQHHDRGWQNRPELFTKNMMIYEKEYLPGEQAKLTELSRPKKLVKKAMKLGVSYNIYDGTELLRDSILSIRENVDHISIVYQVVSNKGNILNEDTTDLMMDILAEGLIDDVLYYTPDIKIAASINELNKRNIGYVNSHEHGCTHHLSMDCDEFYDKDEFKFAKTVIDQHDADSSACRMLTYYKNNKTVVWPPEDYLVPFIYKIRPEFMFSFINWPVLVDPTRRIVPGNNYIFSEELLKMHHFSYVRNNLTIKLSNSSANVNWTRTMQDKVIKHFKNWKPGDKALFAPGVYHQTKEIEPKFLLSWDF